MLGKVSRERVKKGYLIFVWLDVYERGVFFFYLFCGIIFFYCLVSYFRMKIIKGFLFKILGFVGVSNRIFVFGI